MCRGTTDEGSDKVTMLSVDTGAEVFPSSPVAMKLSRKESLLSVTSSPTSLGVETAPTESLLQPRGGCFLYNDGSTEQASFTSTEPQNHHLEIILTSTLGLKTPPSASPI